MKSDIKTARVLVVIFVVTLALKLFCGCAFYRGIDSGTRTYGLTNAPAK